MEISPPDTLIGVRCFRLFSARRPAGVRVSSDFSGKESSRKKKACGGQQSTFPAQADAHNVKFPRLSVRVRTQSRRVETHVTSPQHQLPAITPDRNTQTHSLALLEVMSCEA